MSNAEGERIVNVECIAPYLTDIDLPLMDIILVPEKIQIHTLRHNVPDTFNSPQNVFYFSIDLLLVL